MNIEKLIDRLEAQGGILTQSDAVCHMAVILSEMLQKRLLANREPIGAAHYVKLDFSIQEISRIVWLAAEVAERGQFLSDQIDALYSEAGSEPAKVAA